MTQRKLTGYTARAELQRASRSNASAQQNLRRLLNEQPGPQQQAILLARIAASLGEQLEALTALQRVIVQKSTN